MAAKYSISDLCDQRIIAPSLTNKGTVSIRSFMNNDADIVNPGILDAISLMII